MSDLIARDELTFHQSVVTLKPLTRELWLFWELEVDKCVN